MVTYKNVEIAQEFNISNTAVTNWIEAAIEKKNNLQLQIINGKFKIVKTEHNRAEMLRLSEQGKIYKNKSAYAQTTPSPEFYETFTEDQIIDLINNINLHRVIPMKYIYLDRGAKMWDAFTIEASKNNSYSADVGTQKLLESISENILDRTSHYDNINIFDVGTGNSESMATILKLLTSANKSFKYFGVDISKEMLEISEKNILTHFKGVAYTKYIQDIEKMNLSKLLFLNKKLNDINIIFFTGGTIGNMENRRRVLENFRYSMDNEDFFILTNKVEKEDYKADFTSVGKDKKIITWIPTILGIDVESSEFVNKYDEKVRSRASYLSLDKDYEITFSVAGVEKKVNLYKGENLQIWFHHMSTKNELLDDLDHAGFELLDLTTTKEISHILTVCKAKV